MFCHGGTHFNTCGSFIYKINYYRLGTFWWLPRPRLIFHIAGTIKENEYKPVRFLRKRANFVDMFCYIPCNVNSRQVQYQRLMTCFLPILPMEIKLQCALDLISTVLTGVLQERFLGSNIVSFYSPTCKKYGDCLFLTLLLPISRKPSGDIIQNINSWT